MILKAWDVELEAAFSFGIQPSEKNTVWWNINHRCKVLKIYLIVFQPLLQIYLLLPCLIKRISCQKADQPLSDFFSGSLQIYSIVSSVVSLAWSFSTYEANQKKGALDFSSNPMARIVILISALMQVMDILSYFCHWHWTWHSDLFNRESKSCFPMKNC